MKLFILMLAVLFSVVCFAQDKPADVKPPEATPEAKPEEKAPDVCKVLTEKLEKFLKAEADEQKKLSEELVPTEKEFKAFFVDADWEKAKKYYTDLWAKKPFVFTPKKEQTKVIVWKATIDEFKKAAKERTGDAKNFPGNYAKAVEHIRPGTVVYHVLFVKPPTGKFSAWMEKWGAEKLRALGSHVDGLVCIDNKWVVFPYSWKPFEKPINWKFWKKDPKNPEQPKEDPKEDPKKEEPK